MVIKFSESKETDVTTQTHQYTISDQTNVTKSLEKVTCDPFTI